MLCMPTPAAFEGQFFILTRFGGIQALTGLIAAAPGTTTPGTCGQLIATTTCPAIATTTSGSASRARGLIPEVRSLRTPIPCVGTDQFPKTCAAAMRTKNHRVRRSGRADASNARRTPPLQPPRTRTAPRRRNSRTIMKRSTCVLAILPSLSRARPSGRWTVALIAGTS